MISKCLKKFLINTISVEDTSIYKLFIQYGLRNFINGMFVNIVSASKDVIRTVMARSSLRKIA